ncbi:MAG: DedA family protein [Erythrobacter sp.]
MDKAAHPKAQLWLAFFCFVESSFFPIPPHPLLGLMCLAEPNRAIRYGIIATLSSVAGGLFGYFIGWGMYDLIGEWLIGILGLTESFPTAACFLKERDWQVILIAGSTPVPFKLLTITAGFIEMNLVTFFLASLAGRGMIFLTVGILFRLFGAPIKQVIDRYLGWVTTAFVLLVVGGFVAFTQLSQGEDNEAECAGLTQSGIG